jgi:hypothetical protein
MKYLALTLAFVAFLSAMMGLQYLAHDCLGPVQPLEGQI